MERSDGDNSRKKRRCEASDERDASLSPTQHASAARSSDREPLEPISKNRGRFTWPLAVPSCSADEQIELLPRHSV
jgi:hypothetical protein